jgi:RNA polymerase sigma-70 factor (ECF subfamily)
VNAADPHRFQLGDEQAVRAAIAHYSPRLHPLIASFARDVDDAEDLLQATWIRAFQKRHSYDGGNFLAWLCTICRNVCITRYRTEHNRQQLLRGVDAETRVLNPGEAAADVGRITEVITMLPPRQRDVITYRLIEGYSTRETAQRMECAEGTVKALLHQAIGTVRSVLNPKETAL